MDIRVLGKNDLPLASSLVWNVFSDFVAPGYAEEGIETFKKFIQPEELEKSINSGRFFMLGGFEEGILAGVLAMRDNNHVSLFFVDKAFHCQGIGRKLFNDAVRICIKKDPELNEISVNSSPYAVSIYGKLGFHKEGEENIQNGITYIPMKMEIQKNDKKNVSSEEVRHIKKNELRDLLLLYKDLNKDDRELKIDESLMNLWDEILKDPSQNYLVFYLGDVLVASCVLVIVKNLTRGARPYGLIENVVTHRDCRRKGYGTRLIKRAIDMAKEKGCYKVMLMSGRGEDTLKFYEHIGFERGKKTGFIIRFD
ncbi:GNAT family N-acetyltransferase [Pseudobacteroides cellulosolvens]|uniref:GCN5-related N-acetyltransferase n=1 Tax=Pseudobacteroides cellulosolvens ATCC 35603 = DSM 2933 TaxID=398512 RepID=A0A0L6JI56_9FIRM|nr:GNAT family N-acetyltransferase [Pseudobacteroides cellulosolvens]KNY25157.1 GCN5-related N-acetyltransferase [Pseudobacteroides cellulosolvens ATCC 35603 = DSM 2933]